MRSSISILTLLYAALLIGTGCKKAQDAQVKDRPTSATIIVPSNPTLSGVLGTGHNVKDTIRLTSAVSWRLSGLVYVDSADVLMIDPCTTIKGNLSTGGSGVPGGGLVICRGAKVLAQGTCACPIVFTSAAANPQPGDWAGIIILGNASSNHGSRVQVEGVPSNPPASATFGGTTGTNDADNSGIFSYVRIEYAGFALSLNNEINSLTLAGVGSGTQLDHICSYKSNDDAFEWFGGTVNASYLIATDPLDDMFDTDNGYRGTIRFALGLSDTSRADQSQSNGIESDNISTGSNATPITHPKFRQLTIIGQPRPASVLITNGAPSGTGKYGRAAHIRRNSEFEIDSAIFLGYNWAVSLDTATLIAPTTPAKYKTGTNPTTWMKHTYAHAYFTATTPAGISPYISENNGDPVTGTNFFTTVPGRFFDYAKIASNGNFNYNTTNPNQNLQLGGASTSTLPFNRSNIANFVPGALSPARQYGAFPNGVTSWVCTPWARIQ